MILDYCGINGKETMTDQSPQDDSRQAAISRGSGISAIWIIPIVALILGAGMVVYSFVNEGPVVEISFNTADDLVAGKTKIKMLSVDVGYVESVALKPDVSGVVVSVKLEKQYENLLKEDSQFWVERVRVGTSGVSGLGTILSGAYIKLSPGVGIAGRRSYVGLESPPLTAIDAPGVHLVVESDHASTLSAGDSVLYNGYTVGRVESMVLDENSQKLHYDVFIDAPFDNLVTRGVRFWSVSGLSFSASAEGFNVTVGSIDTMLSGGLSFSVPPGVNSGSPVEDGTVFGLYGSYQDSLQQQFTQGAYYVISFKQSVGGLTAGAPVKYRGITVGKVDKLLFKDLITKEIQGSGDPIPVLIYLEPGRLAFDDTPEAVKKLQGVMELAVSNGLRATLQTGNILTGSLFINFDYYPDEKATSLGSFKQYATIPTISGGLDQIQLSVTQLLKKLNALPLEKTLNKADNAIIQLDKSLAAMNKILRADETRSLPAQMNDTLSALKATLDGLSQESPMYEELNNSLYELNLTLKSMKELSLTLSDSAALLPAAKTKDAIPEVR